MVESLSDGRFVAPGPYYGGRLMEMGPSAALRIGDVRVVVEDRAQQVVVAVYVVPSAARMRTVARGQKNSASLPDSTSKLLSGILARAKEKTVVLAMGTPYLTEDFPMIQNYICTFSNAKVSEISAAKALFGEIAIRGHLPVTLSSTTVPEPGPGQAVVPASLRSHP